MARRWPPRRRTNGCLEAEWLWLSGRASSGVQFLTPAPHSQKLRLLQVREQERDIALQIREDVKHRRNQQFTRLAEELRAEWEESQTQKIKNLEKLYLASLKNMGEGHRQAKENEPDLDGLARQAAERKKKAEMRHKEALKIQKNKKEMLTKQKTWHIKARKAALLVEKERSAKITSLQPPPPTLFEVNYFEC
ncbi:centrosomal protein of 295 kDa-like [Trichechus manatus latirostris]|uniref:Centrosomal protein of 295 kDa-like n=1 Tax=Trichechus manatus latirostris TaxID=127582 RepID=A0A2Y9RVE4_TRIMA|nr:centrosomal protein of 295 kDa-like [Trichechus manatus latirostris]